MENVHNTVEFKDLLYPILGEVKSKHYFSSYNGFFKNKILFGLSKDGRLFLRLTDEHLAEIQSVSETFPLNDPTLKIRTHDFYFIAPQLYQQLQQYSHWFDYILKANLEKKRHIRHLPNMNINLERLLYRNGICSVDEFLSLGEINIFVTLIKNGEDINEMLLFKLYGARVHKIVYNLNAEEKRNLLKEVDIALYDAGLRKRFISKY